MTDKHDKKKHEDQERAMMERFVDLVHKRLKEFNLSAVKDETHLRKIISDRVLASALHCFTVSTNEEKAVLLEDLPIEQQEEHLNRLMLRILDDLDGPGPMLRRSIARLILDYRLRLRLKELLSTLPSTSTKYRRVEKGIAYVESHLRVGILALDGWPVLRDDSLKKEFIAMQRKIMEAVLEEPQDAEKLL